MYKFVNFKIINNGLQLFKDKHFRYEFELRFKNDTILQYYCNLF